MGERPIKVEGKVVPTKTSGRGTTPDSITGFSSVGTPDVQKGHLMALELGGPNVAENVVPQYANWQGNGQWRKMEDAVYDLANGKRDVQYTVKIAYGRDPRFPKSFDTAAKNGKDVNFTWGPFEQGQDKTDDMMMFRQDDLAHRQHGMPSPYHKDNDLGGKHTYEDYYPVISEEDYEGQEEDNESDMEEDPFEAYNQKMYGKMEKAFQEDATISNQKFDESDSEDDEYNPNKMETD